MMNTRLIRAVIALGAAMLMALGALTAVAGAQAQTPPESAPPGDAAGPVTITPATTKAPARRNYWGAISIANRDFAVGYSYDWPRKAGARKRALRSCRRESQFPRSCRVNMVILNQCGAYAWKRRPNGTLRWGWSRAKFRGQAIRKARRAAGGPKGTKVLISVCTTRP